MSIHRAVWRAAKSVGAGGISRSLASRWPLPVRARIVGGGRMYVDLRSSIGRGIYVTGRFDMPAIEPALQALSEGSVFIDVGANIGFYSVLASRRVGATGHVYSFEIDPRPLRCFRKTVETEGLRNIRIVEAAVSDTDGTAYFDPLDEHGHNRIGSPGRYSRSVRSVRLDSWAARMDRLDRVDVIKVDVEGAEMLVLEGAGEVIRKFRPLIICEAAELGAGPGRGSAALVEWLSAAGYSTEWLSDVWTPTILARPVEGHARA